MRYRPASLASPPGSVCAMRPLFEPDGAGFLPAPFARGPWNERLMHGGAPAALLARAIEGTAPGSDLVVTRLAIDLLGGVPLEHVDVSASLVRPGRRFQVVDATLSAGGRAACLARAVRVRRGSLPGAEAAPHGGRAPPLAPPEAGTPLVPFAAGEREHFYPDACEISHVAGEFGSGAAAAWIRLRGDLLPGEAPSQLARVAAAADFANGLSWILPIERMRDAMDQTLLARVRRSGSPEHRLEVEHRCAVDRLERVDEHSCAVDLDDLRRMQADRVRPRGRAGVEHARDGIGGVVARTHAQDAAVGAIEPRDHDNAIAGLQAREPFDDGLVEHEPCLGRVLERLHRRRREIGQRRFDPADRPKLEMGVGHASDVGYADERT